MKLYLCLYSYTKKATDSTIGELRKKMKALQRKANRQQQKIKELGDLITELKKQAPFRARKTVCSHTVLLQSKSI